MKKIKLTNHIRTRDYLMVKIIRGVTKAGIHLDKRKQADHDACRDWREEEEITSNDELLTEEKTTGSLE